jgi:hypothetical protein
MTLDERSSRALGCLQFALAVGLLYVSAALAAEEPPALPVGLDAYRQWERWPYQRIGIRAYMRSTYDRRGSNEGADASHFLYQQADDFHVADGGAGIPISCGPITGTGPWHYSRGSTTIQETATADPIVAEKTLDRTTFIPEHVRQSLTWTWSITMGADSTGYRTIRAVVPVYHRAPVGTAITSLYDRAPSPVATDPLVGRGTPPGQDVLDLLGRAGTDSTPARHRKVSGWAPARHRERSAARSPGALAGSPAVRR